MAKEYIEREAAIERFTFKAIDRFGMEPTISASNVRAAIAAIPAADVVPVVRCGECKHRTSGHPNCVGRRKDWYCPLGERGQDG